MLGGLDPHTVYLDPESYREMNIDTHGEFGGLGLEVTLEDGVIKVVAPIDGTPADKAGLKAGDIIVHFAGKKITNIYDYTYALDAVKIGKPVDIEVLRKGKRIKLKVTPGTRQ